MNDTQILDWIAGHLTKFTVGSNNATMEYLDDERNDKWVHFVISTRPASNLDLIKGCVAKAMEK